MGRVKEYIMELSEKLDKEFEEITQEEFERHLKEIEYEYEQFNEESKG